MFSIKRIVIAFFLPSIVLLLLITLSVFELLLNINIRTNIMFFYAEYIMLFLPKIIYAISMEFLQKYIISYSVFSLIGVIIVLISLYVHNYLFLPSSTLHPVVKTPLL